MKNFLLFLSPFIFFTNVISSQNADFINQLPPAFAGALSGSQSISTGRVADPYANTTPLDLPIAASEDSPELLYLDENFSPNEDQLKVFGIDFFDGLQTTFAPINKFSAPSDYVLGPNDELSVSLMGSSSSQYSFVIEDDGQITIPEIGQFMIAGKTIKQATDLLDQVYESAYPNSELFVNMLQYRSITVFISGMVNSPGSYTVSGYSDITNFLDVVGGVDDLASLRTIKLFREGKMLAEYDLYELFMFGKRSNNFKLLSGDSLLVAPRKTTVSIYGAVNRPAKYEMLNNESLSDLFEFAQGLSTFASRDSFIHKTYSNSGIAVLNEVDFNNIDNVILKDGDSIFIPSITVGNSSGVKLVGAFKTSGSFPLSSSSKYLTKGNLSDSAYLGIILISRYEESTNSRNIIVSNIDSIESKDGDIIYAFTNTDIDFLNSKIFKDFINTASLSRVKLIKKDLDFFDDSKSDLTTGIGGKSSVQAPDEKESAKSVLEKREELQILFAKNKIIEKCSMFDFLNSEIYSSRWNNLGTINSFKSFESSDLVLRELDKSIPEELINEQLKRNISDVGVSKFFDLRGVSCPKIFDDNSELISYLLASSVFVKGSVPKPGIYPIAGENINLEMIKSFAGSSNLYNAGFVELIDSRGEFSQIALNESDQLITAGSVLNFLSTRSDYYSEAVSIDGAILRPGNYLIKPGDTLSDLLSKAGGYLPSAYPYAGVLIRKSAIEKETKVLETIFREILGSMASAMASGFANSSPEGFVELAKQYNQIKPTGRVVTEFDLSVLRRDPSLNLILEPGDKISIPYITSTISVVGEVFTPITLSYDPKASFNDYLDKAGGKKYFADARKAFILYPNGETEEIKFGYIFPRFGSFEIPPGATIYIPRKETPYNALEVAARVTPVISSFALAAASLATIND